MFCRSRFSTPLPCLVVVLAALSFTGCATVRQQSTLDLPDAANPPGTEAAPAQTLQTSECSVLIQPARGKPRVIQVPITEGDTVQTALAHSKATQRFRRMNIHVLRTPRGQTGSPGEVQKMQVEFDRKRRKVEMEYDYALHPSDRIVVEQDTTTMFDDMVEKLTGRMGIPVLKNVIR
jgi:hypothetical protein